MRHSVVELEQKFMALVEPVLGDFETRELCDAVLGLDGIRNCRQFLRAMRRRAT